MTKSIITLFALLSLAATAVADDSVAVGVRYGGEISSNTQLVKNSDYFEAFGDLYINRLVSVGASLAYSAADHKTLNAFRKEDSYPITALFKVHAPLPYISPYGGFGQALIFHKNSQTTGSPVGFVGANISSGRIPLFLNLEYRHQFNGGDLDFMAGGVGIKF